MRIEVIPQVEIGNIQRVRIGDVLNSTVASDTYQRFRFAVAYMRVSGIDRLAVSIESLLNRGGRFSGAVGIDDEITSIEALEMLGELSSDSTIFHTVSGYIYHPKLYLIDGEKAAVAVVGSGNMTRDGLFRNVEIATAVYLDFESSTDLAVYRRYDELVAALLDIKNPNVQLLNADVLTRLIKTGAIKREAQTREPGPILRPRRARPTSKDIDDLFPVLHVPSAPPPAGRIASHYKAKSTDARPSIIVPPATTGVGGMFIMQLSAFDSSHRTGVKGTPEVLIPHPSIGFFPPLSLSLEENIQMFSSR